MSNIHTLDPERRSSKEKELTNKLVDLVQEYVDEVPLVSFLGIVELVKLDVFHNQKEIAQQDA